MALWVVLLLFLSLPFLPRLLKELGSLAPLFGGGGGGVGRPQDGGDELGWLRRVLPRLRAVLWDAAEQPSGIKDEGFQLWLQEIQDLAYDAEDVIDEVEYEELRRKVEEGEGAGGGQSGGSTSGASPPPFDERAIVHKINGIQRRWAEIVKDKSALVTGDLDDGWADQESIQESMTPTTSLPEEAEVFGRENEKEEIIEFLLASDDETGASSIAITGMGGLGKTTLAQIVYSDTRVKEHFDLKMWVSTTADYDVAKLTMEILACTGDDWQRFRDVENLDVVQRFLVDKLNRRRFLLVIDNVWDRNHNKWQLLSAPLSYGVKGSKVLITTRDARVANICQTRKTVELEGLPFHDCWMLFKRHAFVDGNSGEYPMLEDIGKRIVEKVGGIPLAAKTVGGLLCSKVKESEWTSILESEVWELEGHGEDGVMSVLKLSYQHLSPRLKQCFAYCSLYPKNFTFEKHELVQQWMAQGFLQSGGRGRMEDVGAKCFNDLFDRSFFQFVDGKFVIHDLIHDLAQLMSQYDHLITNIDGSDKILWDSINLRHLSLLTTRMQPEERHINRFCGNRCLRTLAFYFPRNSEFQLPASLFLSLCMLRVLDLSSGGIETLPDSIGNLIHLRYLDLRRNNLTILPVSLCDLYKLQTLKLEGCPHIKYLPQGISNLINLRYLGVEPHLLSGVHGVGKLTCLQELESFQIFKDHGIKLEVLKGMNELRGRLGIRGLQNVTSKEEASRAMLSCKQFLHTVEMEWQSRIVYGDSFQKCRSSKLEEEVLEALAPPAQLKKLVICGYDGVKHPSWMEQRSISNLESLHLDACRKWKSLPALWCLPVLRTVEITECPQLRELPPLPTTLRELVLCDVGLEVLPEFYQPNQSVAGVVCDNIAISSSLTALRIKSCAALKSLQQGLLQHHLSKLSVLEIKNCEQLVQWPDGTGFQGTVLSLQETLELDRCPKLMALPAGSVLSRSLKKFLVTDCPHFLNGPLFAQLHNLSSEAIYVCVEKRYADLACCSEEALQHLRTVDWLEIEVVDRGRWFPRDDNLVDLSYEKQQAWSWRCDDWVLIWRVQVRLAANISFNWRTCLGRLVPLASAPSYLVPAGQWWVRRSPAETGPIVAIDGEDDGPWASFLRGLKAVGGYHYDNSSVSRCLEEHLRNLPWASSLRWLKADGVFHGAFLTTFNLASLEGLWVSHGRETMQLFTDAPPTQLTGLTELQLFDCPELTLPSLQEVIRSLPSLRHLTIRACPKLSSSSFSCSHSPAAGSPSNAAATLETLFVDDTNLLVDTLFVHGQLNSLRGLHVWYSFDLISFTAAAAEGLRSLGKSLRHLSFKECPNLKHLPSDLRSCLPFLRALSLRYCDHIQCLPEGGLPPSMEILVIHDCPALERRCQPQPTAAQEAQQHSDWPKIVHIPVIVIDGDLVQGSYREFLERRDRWRDF